MTREEAIEVVRAYRNKLTNSASNQLDGDIEAFDMAIQALSQEPCTDAVSREAVIEWLKDKDIIKLKSQEYNARKELGSLHFVTQKSGKWINDKNDIPICSRCGYIPQYDRAIDDYEYSNYCPSCGCRMVEPQERSDKE